VALGKRRTAGDRSAAAGSGGTRRPLADRTPASVRLAISATDDFAPGVRGFFERWASVFVGLGITGRRALGKPTTVRYPAEKVVLSPRWRGPLHLTGILGRDEIPTIHSAPPEYNGVIEELHDAHRLPPCVANCPANVDARGQSYFLAQDMPGEAYELVRERNIMPGVLGRICHHPCESACRRNYYDEAIAIRPLHRVAYERYAEVRAERLKPLPVTRSERVAVIGSGPSGLAAALDLMRQGYSVTVYEKDQHPGGALFSGVPAYRLPRDVLKQEIDDLVAMGMQLKLGVSVGEDVPIDYLMGEYDAVLIAAGLQQSRILPLPGAESEGVVGAIEFLKAGNWKGDAGVKGKRVLVIGGGNVAVDCARVALRVGASEVTLASLESIDELPAHPWEIEEAVDEGVILNCSWGPSAVLADDGRVTGMRLQSCLSVFDAQGRFSPQFAEEYSELAADVIVFAIGQSPDLADLVGGSDLLLTERGLLPVDGSLMTTRHAGVFACGEVVTGPGSAIASIATGHEAAESIHRYLNGVPLGEGRIYRPVPLQPHYAENDLSDVEQWRRRAKMPMARGEDRSSDFRQVELGFTHLEGLAEAARCLRCSSDVCVGCTFCARVCPDYCIRVERVDDPEARSVTRYDFDVSKCCFCGLCAEQCPTNALQHTGQYELSFYSRDLTVFDKGEMVRDPGGTRATGADCPAASVVRDEAGVVVSAGVAVDESEWAGAADSGEEAAE
jgi:NADPH-dependent glutamate synthase beta subunit-like oxidoreductase